MSYTVLSKGKPAHECDLPNWFLCIMFGLGPEARIQCNECGQIWERGTVNSKWFKYVEKPPMPPQGPGAGSVPARPDRPSPTRGAH